MHSIHEALVRDEDVIGSSNRTFGLIFMVVFAVIGCWPLLAGEPARWWALAIGLSLLIAALFAPRLLEWPNRLWLRFGLLLHRIISPVSLAIIFYGAIVPTALLLRLFGKDLLRLQRDQQAPSYWIPRDPPGPTAESLKNQF